MHLNGEANILLKFAIYFLLKLKKAFFSTAILIVVCILFFVGLYFVKFKKNGVTQVDVKTESFLLWRR